MANITPQSEYVLGNSSAEHDRLARQGRMVTSITQHWLESTGLAPGMRVLDVGCGVGDVSLTVARIVGLNGYVTCVDMDVEALETAEQRANREGLTNLAFHQADFHVYCSGSEFDAAVGRCLLLHQKDPAASLGAVARYVRRGGIIAFQEPWFSRSFSYPNAPQFEQTIGWLHRTMQATGFDVDIGLRLSSLFVAIGLPRPQLTFEMLVEGNPGSEIWEYIAGTTRSLLPRMQQLGIVSPEIVRIDTLAQRLRLECAALETIVGVMPLMGACCRKP